MSFSSQFPHNFVTMVNAAQEIGWLKSPGDRQSIWNLFVRYVVWHKILFETKYVLQEVLSESAAESI